MGQRSFLHQGGSIISHILLVSYYSHLVRPHPVAQPSLIFDSVGFNFSKFCGNLDNQNHVNVNANIQYNSNQPAADRSINVEEGNKSFSHPNAIMIQNGVFSGQTGWQNVYVPVISKRGKTKWTASAGKNQPMYG